MPTYEYKCFACDHQFERFQSITAAAIKKCPECGKSKVKRLLGTGAGLIFKGSGFYITDYRSDSYKNAAKADSSSTSSSGEGKSGETKSSEGSSASATPSSTEPKASALVKSESKPSSSKGSSSKKK